jgi:hypothetical protein
MNAKVNGGIFVKASLKIGGAAPQIIFAVSIAITPPIYLVYRKLLCNFMSLRYGV